MKTLEEARLYGILDLGYTQEDSWEATALQMCEGGVDLLQVRAKGRSDLEVEQLAQRIASLLEEHGVPLIINDFPEIVPAVGAQGAHVGQDDLSVEAARWRAARSLGPDGVTTWIGKSTHSITQALSAAEDGADYIGFGPLYPTPTKPGRPAVGLNEIREVHERLQIPIFCIGGIKLENLDEVLAAGARRVVVVSGILQAADIAGYCQALQRKLRQIELCTS